MTPQTAPVRLDPAAPRPQESVRTDRLSLRPVRRSDQGLIELYAGRREVAEMTTAIPHPLPPGSTDAFVTRCLSGESNETVWVMDASEAGLGELVGVISLTQMDRAQAEIGYWVAPVVWNTGLATEALRALMQANPLGNSHIFGTVFQDNPASARVLTNAGFDYIGEAEAFCVARGAIVPQWTYIRHMA
ncbi:GNAT family N-acetyltransferase [Jannaschia seohaensis]|uniref:Protein N-acetyltransferase, RimJ/RimL family n=1 Tax=Jannaschia seohaensis TaxID=475081 RepID=A0A2Y9AND1_9RHOB|nr:GNAT family N-acetyltransferase [Jannaschia seohaensis]PWJ19372.1 RimJ/RimL family protein N-acetyltransferase [Jannaschia seohaensis]SSA46034.1 Protein N-acetyltransferase, RimJ/RimL family [Jannaschia seohaensis]